jgi:uncharacterized membrane protein
MLPDAGAERRAWASRVQRVAIGTVSVLALLELLWELWLAPLRPGGSWLALKAVPLALFAVGLVRGRRRAAQWLTLLLPLYVAEAIVRALTESGRHGAVAAGATLLAGAAFVAVLAAARAGRVPPGA